MSVLPRHLLPDTTREDPSGHLRIGGIDVLDLAADFGTPLFVYDEAHLRARAAEAVEVLGRDGAIYATKAFLCRAMAAWRMRRACAWTSRPVASWRWRSRPGCPRIGS